MSTQTVCDHCGKVLSPHLSSYRLAWSNDFGRPPRDYCSTPCAVLALGGGAHAMEPADTPGYVSIPWPPSEELRIRVEGIIADALRTASIRIRDELTLIEAVKWCTNAVLDVIGGDR